MSTTYSSTGVPLLPNQKSTSGAATASSSINAQQGGKVSPYTGPAPEWVKHASSTQVMGPTATEQGTSSSLLGAGAVALVVIVAVIVFFMMRRRG